MGDGERRRLTRNHPILIVARGPNAQTLGVTIAAQALTLMSGVIAARALGVDGRGQLALLWLLPLILAQLGGIGIPQATTYFVARDPGNTAGIVRMSLSLVMTLALLVSIAYAVGLVFLSDSGRSFSTLDGALSVSLIPFLLFQGMGPATLLGLSNYTAFNVARIAPAALYAFGAIVLLAVGGATLTSFLATSLTAWLVGGVFGWWLLLRQMPPGRDATEANGRKILGFGARGVIGGFSAIDDVRLDQVFVGLWLDARSLGLYVAAVAFCNLPKFVAQGIGAVAFPRVASSATSQQAWAETYRALRIGATLIVLCVTGLILTLPFLLPFMFGEDFKDAIPIGRILLLGALFLAIHRLLNELARGLGHPGYGSITELVNTVVFLVGLAIFATPPSAEGVAYAVVAGGVASSFLLALLLIRLRSRSDGFRPPAPPATSEAP